MNRAERRRLGSAAPKVYTLTEDQIQQLKREAVDEAFIKMLAAPCLALHDHFGFGRSRLSRFMDSALTWYESIQNGEVSLDEIMRVLEVEAGIQVIKGSGSR